MDWTVESPQLAKPVEHSTGFFHDESVRFVIFCAVRPLTRPVVLREKAWFDINISTLPILNSRRFP